MRRRARPSSARSKESARSEEHTSELQSQSNLVCRLLLEKKKQQRQARDFELDALDQNAALVDVVDAHRSPFPARSRRSTYSDIHTAAHGPTRILARLLA